MKSTRKTEKTSCDIEAKTIQSKIDSLTDQMNPGNFIELRNQVAALKIKLRARRNEIDFTMNNRMDWGVRVITFQTT